MAVLCAAVLALSTAAPALARQDAPPPTSEEVLPPERIHYVPPVYPEAAKKEGVTGKVELEIIVDRAGKVESAKVIRSHPAFDEAAVTAVKQWRYRPALKDGKPVRVYLTVIVDFHKKKE